MKNLEGLSGINAAMTAALAEQFLDDPQSIQEPWRSTFAGLSREALIDLVGDEAVAVWEARKGATNGQHTNGHAGVDLQQALAGYLAADQLRLDWATRELVEAYRRHGHRHANTNPLAPTAPGVHFDLGAFGISQADLDRAVATDVPMHEGATLRDVIAALEATYCGTISVEATHVRDDEARRWLQDRVERSRNQPRYDAATRAWILQAINEATLLEEFVHRKFVGAKRFSVEGGESLIPMMRMIIEAAGNEGVTDVIMGMAHRGRLNVMVNILHKSTEALFAGFQDGDAKAHLGRGDVKYHHGLSKDLVTRQGHTVHASLCFNPSHLEFVNPVVLGRARAKQDRCGDPRGQRIMPLLIHGDSAVVGQGIVAESLNLAGLEGYSTGGTLHIVVNNQIGFTTEPHEGRTTPYATDIAAWIGAPVLRVNGDDPEAAVHAAAVAVEFRQRFGIDIFIDLLCYRRHGHNEGDEPRFTQPLMYQSIDQHPSLRQLYGQRLMAESAITAAEIDAHTEAWTESNENALREALNRGGGLKPESMSGVWSGYVGGVDAQCPQADTGVERERLLALGLKITTPPEGFDINRKLRRVLDARQQMTQGASPLDWGTAEVLAYASLLDEGYPVRLSGQDAQRGTFSHRHAVMHDAASGICWNALEAACTGNAAFRVYNSPLSEAAVMGFDWGYSLDRPDGLTIWEAQFGDFANGAQVIIDQFLTSSEDKWERLSGLVLLLPHGFAGQGPEHSSARLERFLGMAAEDNIQVCNPTTPAQIFHLMRRQVVRALRKPLIIMSPKALLRHRRAVSDLDELATGGFQRILPDSSGVEPSQIKRLLLCSGQIYFDLEASREAYEAHDTAIIRFEQLYPLTPQEIEAALAPYAHAEHFWVQDEPWNMGPWLHIQATLRRVFGHDHPVKVISRAASASPATGSKASHDYEAQALMELAFGRIDIDETGAVRVSAV